MVTQVYRRGYTFGGEVVRPAMVVVARPVETPVEADAADGSVDDEGPAHFGGASGGG
jgi:hypothetical protein